MIYTHRFVVNAPLTAVADFHSSAASLAAITPPPLRVKIDAAPASLSAGSEMAFTLWLGPLPLRWLARIELASFDGFRDSQLHGPFDTWVHTHYYIRLDDCKTEVHDEIHLRLSRQPFKRLVGAMMAASLPALFAYRGWKTRRLLEPSSLRISSLERKPNGSIGCI